MRTWRWLASCMAISLSLAGCGGSDKTESAETSAPAAKEAGDRAATTAEPTKSEDATAGPRAALTKFLTAIKSGDDNAAAAMLTPLALQKTTEFGLNVTPEKSDTAKFRVTDVEMKGTTGAYAACEWTEVDDHGATSTDQVVWVMALQESGWRIAGMVAKIFPDMDAIVFNFEDPEDMIRKQEMAVQEMQRRAAAEAGHETETAQEAGSGGEEATGNAPAASRSGAPRR